MFRELTETHDNTDYCKIVLSLLCYKSSNVVLHTYLTLNKTVKKLLNNCMPESCKIDRLIKNVLCTEILNEILCFGCVNTNNQVIFLFISTFFMNVLLKMFLCVYRYVNLHQKLLNSYLIVKILLAMTNGNIFLLIYFQSFRYYIVMPTKHLLLVRLF